MTWHQRQRQYQHLVPSSVHLLHPWLEQHRQQKRQQGQMPTRLLTALRQQPLPRRVMRWTIKRTQLPALERLLSALLQEDSEKLRGSCTALPLAAPCCCHASSSNSKTLALQLQLRLQLQPLWAQSGLVVR